MAKRITGTKTNMGPAVKIESALAGIISSFTSNFRPSAISCNTPSAPAYSGPILLSSSEFSFQAKL